MRSAVGRLQDWHESIQRAAVSNGRNGRGATSACPIASQPHWRVTRTSPGEGDSGVAGERLEVDSGGDATLAGAGGGEAACTGGGGCCAGLKAHRSTRAWQRSKRPGSAPFHTLPPTQSMIFSTDAPPTLPYHGRTSGWLVSWGVGRVMTSRLAACVGSGR